ncbi:phage regulatory protein/antirepressor Ant [uncultured Bacteroides sp.]|uniref:phage regulatory protein/antirepressor Ant n=1 Tax=uncultured Bacteroides sp. TaxID=162156 RepID=UPI0025F61945|nr:phage regulatory protein/antirepressor Ant [uncultured Bacteroides sp.]
MGNLELIKETMSSIEIAELTGKPHNDVMKAIRVMEPAWEKVQQGKFSLMFKIRELPNGGHKEEPYYELTKTECLYVATKFNDEARAKLILRWEQLENERRNGNFQVPASFKEALLLAAHQQEEIELQQKQIEANKPKVLFAEAVSTSQRSCLISELAKIISQNGVAIGQNRLFAWMRKNGYLCNKGQYYNQPTQKAMEMGLFEIKKTTITKPNGDVIVNTTSKVTGKGQIYFVNKFIGKEN